MKRVVILVPDEMTEVRSKSDWSLCNSVPVNKETIVYALSTNDYHANWFFGNPESIVVEEITDVTE